MKEETRRKILSVLSVTFALAFALALGWGIYEYRTLQDYKLKTENQYKQALNDLVTTLNEVETSMAKAKVANSPAQKVLYLSETWKGANDAVAKLSSLPADEVGISYVDTLVNQVGDFSKTMTRKVASVESMSAEEQDMFNDMHERVIEVNRNIQQLANQFYAENLAWVDKPPGILQRLGIGRTTQTAAQGGESGAENQQGGEQARQETPTSVRGGLKQLDASLQKYPPFTYQGELDKHTTPKPLGLPEGEINENKAVTVAKEFLQKLGYENPQPQVTGLSQQPLGGFDLTYDDSYLEVSKKGGVVTFYRDQREIGDRKLDVKKGIDKANTVLNKLGWKLAVTSTQDFGSYLQVEAVAEEKGVRLYPDKVRITVALDNGDIVGFDANPYYAYHHDRQLIPKLTLDQAKAKLNKDFKILENRLAVISKIGTEEAFCYEFRGTAYGEEYLVYINALDGSEEKISRVVNTPSGKLIQ
ncbi:MAG TPA: peptidase M4 [Peptococcaceae bacterium]|nr:peptidase M4 [Peptococcaceae bacterium]